MLVETTRFGTVEVSDDEVVAFPEGLPGFPGSRRMILLGGGQLPGSADAEGHHSLFWIQDVDDGELAFLSIVPWSAYPDYDIDVDPSEIDPADPDDLCVLNLVAVRREDGGVRLTTNLLAPVVIDTGARVGKQVILSDDWPVQAPLAEQYPTEETAAC